MAVIGGASGRAAVTETRGFAELGGGSGGFGRLWTMVGTAEESNCVEDNDGG